MPEPATLTIDGLTHDYGGGVRVLDEVTLAVPPGVFGLLGPNGAGKSTLMRIMATLQTPTAGTIFFGGIDVVREPARLRRTLGYLPQDFGVYPRISAAALLGHISVLKGVADRRERCAMVDALLDRVNLWDVRHQAVANFSGGMRQRFGVAQALIGDPRLVIVDEPTAGLDPQERNRLLDLLAAVGDRSVVILSTHIVEDVADLCPRMAILCAGRVLAQGGPAELIERLRGRIWRKVIERSELDATRDRHRLLSSRLLGGRTVVHVEADVRPAPGFEATPGGLEDVFFSVLRASRSPK